MADSGLPFFARFTEVVFRCIFAVLTRVKVEGRENIPSRGPVLVICNHASNADGPVLMAYFVPAMGRQMTWLGKEEALRWPIVGWAIRQNGVVGVRRGAGDLEAFRTAMQALDDGRPLAVFPEGTRSKDGALQAAKQGATVLALRSGAPILPVAIVGSQRFWARGKRLPHPGRGMRVRIGCAFHLTLPGGDRHAAMDAATVELMGHIAELLPPEQRGVYGEPIAAPSSPAR